MLKAAAQNTGKTPGPARTYPAEDSLSHRQGSARRTKTATASATEAAALQRERECKTYIENGNIRHRFRDWEE